MWVFFWYCQRLCLCTLLFLSCFIVFSSIITFRGDGEEIYALKLLLIPHLSLFPFYYYKKEELTDYHCWFVTSFLKFLLPSFHPHYLTEVRDLPHFFVSFYPRYLWTFDSVGHSPLWSPSLDIWDTRPWGFFFFPFVHHSIYFMSLLCLVVLGFLFLWWNTMTMTKISLGMKGLISSYSSQSVHHLGKSAGTWGRKWCRGYGGVLFIGSFLIVCSACFLWPPGPPWCPGLLPPAVTWALPHQSTYRKCTIHFVYR